MADCFQQLGIPKTTALILPNGEVLTSAKQYPIRPVPPFSSVATVRAFLDLNVIMRPPLSDDEIALMPVEEVISLYYRIKRVTGYDSYVPDPLISNGLAKNLGVEHEANLQNRIYNLRPDLHQVTVGNRVYRVLLPPGMMKAPKKPDSLLSDIEIGIFNFSFPFLIGVKSELKTQIVETVTSIALNFVPVVGIFLSIAYSASIQVVRAQELKAILKTMQMQQSIVDEISDGADYAKQIVPNPAPDSARIQRLGQACTIWQQRIPQMIASAKQLNVQVVHFCDPAYTVFSTDPSYIADWSPWWNYFLSKAVHDMVFPQLTQPVTPAGQATPAGAGALALLLLLL